MQLLEAAKEDKFHYSVHESVNDYAAPTAVERLVEMSCTQEGREEIARIILDLDEVLPTAHLH